MSIIKKHKNTCEYNPLILKDYEIFSGLNEDQIDKFCKVITPIQFNKDDVIIQEGDPGDSILILLDGKVEISQALTLKTNVSQADTREKSLISLSSDFRPFFGEMSLFSENDKRSATVKAAAVCGVAKIGKDKFFKICNDYPEIGNQVMQNIARVMSRRLMQANQNVLKLTTAFSLIIDS
ncbi:cyclic nucleotide-binding domain-containing protein [bacterium]|nr:cyclic nucleotide-binding domain-containing protein [bacterium]MBU1063240.1 cyclic nucleotide-binding domain-containing protein [bacterium]MBU1635426.1 cyclic nucleotide-binding domain-containing protein [bacterium]MBU1873175.1 cyclic nucleotide-binding domain-containing protein [bacterium]